MEVLLIDHRDSFSYNVKGWLEAAGSSVLLIPYDDLSSMLTASPNRPLVLSPGPDSPASYPNSAALVARCLDVVPILGLCLGHQIIGELAGCHLTRSLWPKHGCTKEIAVETSAPVLFRGLPRRFDAAVYHSLVLTNEVLHPNWQIVATDQKAEVMALERSHAGRTTVATVQFHPESFLTPLSSEIAKNAIKFFRDWPNSQIN